MRSIGEREVYKQGGALGAAEQRLLFQRFLDWHLREKLRPLRSCRSSRTSPLLVDDLPELLGQILHPVGRQIVMERT